MKSQAAEPAAGEAAPALLAATAHSLSEDTGAPTRARAFAEPLLAREELDTGENTLAHADGVADILRTIGGSHEMQAASYLVYACAHLSKPQESIATAFGQSYAELAIATTQLVQVQRQTRALHRDAQDGSAAQTENVRKMLLAFSRDLRVVLLRLASRLQTLRYFAATKKPLPPGLAAESLRVFAPLANRLGIWEIKWEMEDLAFRFLEPDTYKQIAQLLDEKRVERESHVARLREEFEQALAAQGIKAQVQGRPKHIYSIVKKMRDKSLDFSQIHDVRALRIIVSTIPDCYAVLAWVHSRYTPVADEFDDYIARPKANGYQSLHTVVLHSEQGGTGRPLEIQIRTQAMHEHAELGVAAHWAYKEAGAKGFDGGARADSAYDAKIAVLRQLLAWERDFSNAQSRTQGMLDDRIYVLTPQASIVELPQSATPVDFAYSVHTSLGHRCRGARVDGVMVPLNTPLKNGQTVEIIAAKEGSGQDTGPSRDWLNPESGYLASPRARAKVRAWFNAQVAQETPAQPAKAESAPAPAAPPAPNDTPHLKRSRSESSKSGVLVVGVDSLLTQLAKCCKPAPPDPIRGFVTRGKGVSVHRSDCTSLRQLAAKHGERVIDVEWGRVKPGTKTGELPLYPLDVVIEAADRQGLLRDILDVFAKEKINVVAAQTQTTNNVARMNLTVEVTSADRLAQVFPTVSALPGVWKVRRR